MTNHKANEHTGGKAIEVIEILDRLTFAVAENHMRKEALGYNKRRHIDDKAADEARQALYTLFEREVIGVDDAYDDLCEHCNNWDDGRNSLRESQRATLRKLLGVTK